MHTPRSIREAAGRRLPVRRWLEALTDPGRLSKPGKAAIFTGEERPGRPLARRPSSQHPIPRRRIHAISMSYPCHIRLVSAPYPPAGTYIGLAGLALLCAPLTILSLIFDASAVSAAWVRVGGVLCAVFGIYYVGTGAGEALGMGAEAFYWSTIVGRVFLAVAFTGLVVTGKFPEPGLLVVRSGRLPSRTPERCPVCSEDMMPEVVFVGWGTQRADVWSVRGLPCALPMTAGGGQLLLGRGDGCADAPPRERGPAHRGGAVSQGGDSSERT